MMPTGSGKVGQRVRSPDGIGTVTVVHNQDNVTVEFPDKKLVGSCTLCKYMKSNSLQDILRVLKNPTDRDRVILDPVTRQRALKTIEAMFHYNRD